MQFSFQRSLHPVLSNNCKCNYRRTLFGDKNPSFPNENGHAQFSKKLHFLPEIGMLCRLLQQVRPLGLPHYSNPKPVLQSIYLEIQTKLKLLPEKYAYRIAVSQNINSQLMNLDNIKNYDMEIALAKDEVTCVDNIIKNQVYMKK